jgi:hypothetical protein
MTDQQKTFMQTRKNRGVRPRTAVLLALATAFGLASACLNPDISDEPPLSERAAALDAPDAGTPTIEGPSSVEPSPSERPSRSRRDVVRRDPARR